MKKSDIFLVKVLRPQKCSTWNIQLTGAQLLTVAEYLAAAPILSAVLQKIFRKTRSSAMEQPAPRPEADSMPAE